MGVAIVDKDVSLVSSINGIAKGSIDSVIDVTGWSGPSIVTDNLFMELDASDYTSGLWLDRTVNGNNATIDGATWSSANGGVFILDGVNDSITIPSNTTLDFSTTSFKTIQMWVNFSNIPSSTSYLLFGKGSSSTTDGYSLGLVSISEFTFVRRTSPSGVSGSNSVGASILSNTWYLITFAAQVTTAPGSAKIYKNTSQVGFGDSYGKNTFTGDSTPLTLGYAPTPIMSRGGTYLDGKIGACYFYTKELSLAEITQNFDATKSKYGL